MNVDLLWDGPPARTRGPKAALSLHQIADAAIAVADAEGLDGVSMQRVAAELGYTKMSLYRYVPGKAELIAVMLERGLGEPPDVASAGPGFSAPSAGPPAGSSTAWREALTGWCRALFAKYAAHPWASEATLRPRPLGPHELAWMEQAVAALPTGLTGFERLDTVAVLALHTRTLAAQAAHAPQEAEFAAAIGTVLLRHADRFPAVAAAMADAAGGEGRDQAFEYGLARILDGVEVLVRRRVTGR
jgi:AcrR family transcriptional regulator